MNPVFPGQTAFATYVHWTCRATKCRTCSKIDDNRIGTGREFDLHARARHKKRRDPRTGYTAVHVLEHHCGNQTSALTNTELQQSTCIRRILLIDGAMCPIPTDSSLLSCGEGFRCWCGICKLTGHSPRELPAYPMCSSFTASCQKSKTSEKREARCCKTIPAFAKGRIAFVPQWRSLHPTPERSMFAHTIFHGDRSLNHRTKQADGVYPKHLAEYCRRHLTTIDVRKNKTNKNMLVNITLGAPCTPI